jgi:hypothetical protein
VLAVDDAETVQVADLGHGDGEGVLGSFDYVGEESAVFGYVVEDGLRGGGEGRGVGAGDEEGRTEGTLVEDILTEERVELWSRDDCTVVVLRGMPR